MEEQERNVQILNALVQANLTDNINQIDVATPVDGAYIPDTVNYKASRNKKVSEQMLEEITDQAEKDVEELKKQTEEQLVEFMKIGKEYIFFNEGEKDPTLEVKEKANKLLAKLQNNGPLTTSEFNKLVEYTAEMNFNEMVRNTVDIACEINFSNLDKLEKLKSKKIIAVFKPLMTKFSKKFQLLKDEKISKINPGNFIADSEMKKKNMTQTIIFNVDDANQFLLDILKDPDFEDIAKEQFSANHLKELEAQMQENNKLLIEAEEKCMGTLNANGRYDLQQLKDRDAAWDKFSENLIDYIEECQLLKLKESYSVARDYLSEIKENGDIVCKVGNETITISRDTIVDDMAKLKEATENIKDQDKIAIPQIEDSIENSNIEVQAIEGNNKDSEFEIDKKIVLASEPVITIDEPIAAEPIEENTEETSIVEPAKEPENEETTINQYEELEKPEIPKDVEAYVTFMTKAAGISEEEALELASIPENLMIFNNSNIGYNMELKNSQKFSMISVALM